MGSWAGWQLKGVCRTCHPTVRPGLAAVIPKVGMQLRAFVHPICVGTIRFRRCWTISWIRWIISCRLAATHHTYDSGCLIAHHPFNVDALAGWRRGGDDRGDGRCGVLGMGKDGGGRAGRSSTDGHEGPKGVFTDFGTAGAPCCQMPTFVPLRVFAEPHGPRGVRETWGWGGWGSNRKPQPCLDTTPESNQRTKGSTQPLTFAQSPCFAPQPDHCHLVRAL